jgi:hypothetical protein
MKKLVIAILALTILASSATLAAEKEVDVQGKFCAGMPINVHLKDGTEVDCYTGDYAIEVDFTDHWAQAIGQALHYASLLERRPAVILVCHSHTKASICLRHRKRFEETLTYWRIGMYLWYCETKDQKLADCEFEDLFGAE